MTLGNVKIIRIAAAFEIARRIIKYWRGIINKVFVSFLLLQGLN
ncbi:MAG: hypothetical protein AB1488_02965 [Nitrospirota bacterium]